MILSVSEVLADTYKNESGSIITERVSNIERELRQAGSKEGALNAQRFFKTGKGQYGEGDKFLGIKVPVLRAIAKRSRDVTLEEAAFMLRSEFHEERMLALFLLIWLYNAAQTDEDRRVIYLLYLANTRFINNWDLVDCSAEHILGAYLRHIDKQPLYELALSANLWERRIAILSTFHFIKHNEFTDALEISKILLNDKQDLIHKAVGWMLREIGKRNIVAGKRFLLKHCAQMPRTMLRYAIERFPETERQAYLTGL